MTKLYDKVKRMLEYYPEFRDSDKKLFWRICQDLGLTFVNRDGDSCMSFPSFLKAPSTESVRRCRQKVMEHFPELRGSKSVTKIRKVKEDTKGTWVYKETAEEQQTLI